MLPSGIRHFARTLCSAASKGEKLLESELRKGIEGIKHVRVEDVSGRTKDAYQIAIILIFIFEVFFLLIIQIFELQDK